MILVLASVDDDDADVDPDVVGSAMIVVARTIELCFCIMAKIRQKSE
jgi:hypothetical protein